MVDEKTVQEVAQQEQQPADPQRRKLLKFMGGAAGVIAVGGGAYLLGRSGGENEASASSVPAESPATTQPNLGTANPTPPTTSPEATPTTQPEAATTIPGETLSIPLESLPTSIDNPQEWADKIYGLLHTVYNDTRRDLVEYVYKGGLDGSIFKEINGGITITGLQIDANPDLVFELSATVIPDRTSLLANIISVDETRTFMGESFRKIKDYSILPETVFINDGGTTKEVTLYLINQVNLVCEYDENGICT